MNMADEKLDNSKKKKKTIEDLWDEEEE